VFVIAASLAVTGCLGGSCYIRSSASTMAGWDGLIPFRKGSMEKPQKFERRANPQYLTMLPQARQN
jgi:hypothetical protein